MSLPQFVTRRGQQLYYRRAFPNDLWPVTGKAAFALSLRTTDPKEALRARPEAERLYMARVDAARTEMARRANMPLLTKAGAEGIAVRWFLDALDTAEDFRAALVRSPEDAAKAREDALDAAGDARRALAEGETADLRAIADRLRTEAGFASEPLADSTLVTFLGRARIAAQEVIAGRAYARFDTRPSDPLFASAMEAPRPSAAVANGQPSDQPQRGPGRTIADLEEAFRKVVLPQQAPGSVTRYEPVFRLLRDLLGASAEIAALTHEDGERLFAAVSALPANAEKNAALKGLPVPKQIEEGQRLGLRTLSAKTINDGYLAALGAVFRFAIKRNWMVRNPVQGLRARQEVAARDARDAFGAERLKVLFGGAPWAPRNADPDGRPIRYFGPLLALYHGLRVGEIAGLRVEDIGDEKGQPMIRIRAGERALKTDSARRDMPVHPELVRLGFLRFVKDRRAKVAATDPLFPGEKAYARAQWGRSLSYWFARHVAGLGFDGRRLTMHALRHDFRDALREAEIETGLADYLMGHAQQGMGAVYGAGRPSLQRLQEAMGKVAYADLNLPGAP